MKQVDTILFVQRRYHPNQHPIVATLQEKGHQVRFLSLQSGTSETYSRLQPDFIRYSFVFLLCYALLKYVFGDEMRHRYGIPRPIWYYRYLRHVDPDIIIVKKYFAISFVTVVYAKVMGIDVVFYDQNSLYRDGGRYLKRRLMTAFYYIFHRERFVRYTPVRGDSDASMAFPQSCYIPFVAPLEPTSLDRDYFLNDKINIVMVGKLDHERKQHLLLLRAVETLRSAFDLRVTLIGAVRDADDDYYHRVRSFISDQELDDIVEIETNIPYEEVQRAYRRHDIFVLPSRNEPAAVSHLEAMRQGLPIILSDTNGTRSYVERGENGYWFSCGEQAELEEKLRLLLSSRTRIREFGAHSRSLTETEYSGDRFYERLSEVVEKEFK